MVDEYRSDIKAHVSSDDEGRVRHVRHTGAHWLPNEESPRRAAIEYMRANAGLLGIPAEGLDRLHEQVDYASPRKESESFRLSEEKKQFDSVTVAFAQTFLNVPVWHSGVTVTVKQGPSRIVESTSTTLTKLDVQMPPKEAIERWRRLLEVAGERTPVVGEEAPRATASDRMVRDALGLGRKAAKGEEGLVEASRGAARLRINRGRFFVYRYDPEQRQPPEPEPAQGKRRESEEDMEPSFPLPPVPESIRPGSDRLVAEVVFSLPFAGADLSWRGLFDVETGGTLFLRALIAGVDGLVFKLDPITSTGDLGNTPDQPNAVLNPLRDDVALDDLVGPTGGVQALSGTRILVTDDDTPAIAPPTKPSGEDFDYDARTNDFAAVSAYYHANELFATIEGLGFDLGTYFDGTSFPVHVDHRASFGTTDGIERNAFCAGDAEGDGIGLVGYCLGDLTDLGNPLGRAVDKYVHWHEICGHGILYDHVEWPNFGFAHSAGDGLAAIQSDPESELREAGLEQRFRYAPFRPIRWVNRKVGDGWAWGGANDVGGYSSEQILATTHFRIYRSIGGDSPDPNRRRFASRAATYLILRAIGDLTPITNPGDPLDWCNRLMATDLLDWTSEGLSGGAYNKVIRWAFEKQGLFQPPGSTGPVDEEGAPPPVDVYIDDGRGGEYPYRYAHWDNVSVWNRNEADGLDGHQPAIAGEVNYAYVKVKNRGTEAAANVTVKGHHCLPGAGLLWPNDFTAMSPAAGLSAASVAAGSAEEVIFGPFEWVPNENVYGHDCMLMIASVDGDPSNVDNFGPGETIAEWRLVPNDNNVGQRNVQLVPGGGGGEGLAEGLDEHVFFVGNTSLWRREMGLEATLPELLRARGWELRFAGGDRFALEPGEKREVRIELVRGRDFDPELVKGTTDRDVAVVIRRDGAVIGGMTYRLDPALEAPPRRKGRPDCRKQAGDLLRCLDLPSDGVRDVKVRKVSLDVCMDDDPC